MKKILILTANFGFGHLSAAHAIAEALQELHPSDCSVEIVNPMLDRRIPAILRKGSPSYDRVVREIPRLFKLAYGVADATGSRAVLHTTTGAMLLEVVHELIHRHAPDAIVSPYPLYQVPCAAAFALDRRAVPVLTVVTDMAPVHRIWFHKAADMCLVPMEDVRQQAIKCGLPPEKVTVTGIPVHPGLTHETRTPAEVRAALGWRRDLATVLAVGSKRVKNLPGILHALNHSGLPIQIAVVAGGDDAVYRQLMETEWHVAAHVYNFVEDMAPLMHAADCVVCKAGGLIVTESLACGLPILLTDLIEGQETSNARHVVEGGAGALAQSPIEALEILCHWLADDGRALAKCGRNARRLGRPRAAYQVAKLAWSAAMRGGRPVSGRFYTDSISRMVRQVRLAPVEARRLMLLVPGASGRARRQERRDAREIDS
jgi:1,2-diacylglycerol 3-beta-galactosyltransferase